ncbi:MAG: DUF3298 and DUF4163 domain-containing protein [Clostridia bacterium]|nr:DUF3298 and DUF4163 domain-containing protein [Clostridia bacterium]
MVLKAECTTKAIRQTMHFKNVEVLSYEILYPLFSSSIFFKGVQKINNYYRENAMLFEKYCRTALYRMACESAAEAMKNGYMPIKFDAVQSFTLTYNENCAISLYIDRYMFTGGAHGLTERVADTFELGSGAKRIELSDLFPDNFSYKPYITDAVIKQIKRAENGTYFDEYEQNVKECFNKNYFYLTDSGLLVYFQQYDIAPYSSGIPAFVIPYEKNGPMPPKC